MTGSANGLITVGVDGSELGREALRFALGEARLRNAMVRLVHAWSIPSLAAGGLGVVPVYDLLATELGAGAEQLLDSELAAVGEPGSGIEIERRIVRGDAAGALVEHSADADLLVVGSHGHGVLAGFLLGSVSEACVRHSPCPVAIVHAAPFSDGGRIVVGVDGSHGARTAFEWAMSEARLRDVPVRVVVAYEDRRGLLLSRIANADILVELESTVADQARRVLAEILESAPPGLVVEGETVRGEPGETLLAAAQPGDLLVVGSRGRGGFAALLLGSVSRQCAAGAPGVAVVVPKGRDRKPATGG